MFFSALALLSLCFVLFVILFHLPICLCAFVTLNKILLTYLLNLLLSGNHVKPISAYSLGDAQFRMKSLVDSLFSRLQQINVKVATKT